MTRIKTDTVEWDDTELAGWTRTMIDRAATIHNLEVEGGVAKGLKYPNSTRGNTAMVAVILEKKDHWLTQYLDSTEVFEDALTLVWNNIDRPRSAFLAEMRALLRRGTKSLRQHLEQRGHVKTGLLRKSLRWRPKGAKKVK